MEFVQVDGSYGEGGGQILRTALCFSIIQGKPVHVFNIRARRQQPGVRPQHAAVLRILRDISGGRLEGGHVGSTELFFTPDRVETRSLKLDLGTAASITLVLQAVVPAVALSEASMDLEFNGGTDVPWSPTSDYFAMVMAPALKATGVDVEFDVRKRGYYPRGGGIVKATIHPSSGVRPVNLSKRAGDPGISLQSRCGRLPRHVAERQASAATAMLRAAGLRVKSLIISAEESNSPGSSALVYVSDSSCFIGADAIGARGRPAEQVGEFAATEFIKDYQSGSTVDSHLADTLAPTLTLAEGESRVLMPKVTEHLRTSLHVASLFTTYESSFSNEGDAYLLRVRPTK